MTSLRSCALRLGLALPPAYPSDVMDDEWTCAATARGYLLPATSDAVGLLRATC